MNDSELDAKLKAAREPALAADYQAGFPRLVLAGLRSSPQKRAPSKSLWSPRLAWGWGVAAACCVLALFTAGQWHGRVQIASVSSVSSAELLENTKLIRETLAMFPNQVRSIMRDEHGLKVVLADQADVPDSPPLYVKICDGKECSSVVTFSGQEIQIAGQKVTVLAEADGGIILAGSQSVWSSSTGSKNYEGLKVQAKVLSTAAM